MDISTTESLPTSSESTEISEFTEYSYTVNSSEINMETTMIDSDISSSVMYQTGNQNYFTFSVIVGLSITIACILACCLCACFGYFKKRGELWALRHPEEMEKIHHIKRNKQCYKEWVKEGKYEDFVNSIEKYRQECVEWLNEISKLKEEIKENKLKHNVSGNRSMPNVSLAPFGNLSWLISNSNSNRLPVIKDENEID